MKRKIGIVILSVAALIVFNACSSTAAPTTAPLPPQVSTESAPTDLPVASAPTDEPTQAVPTTAAAPTAAPATAVSNDSSGSAGIPIGSIDDVLKKACAAMQAQTNVTSHLVFSGSSNADILIQVAGIDRAHMVMTGKDSASEQIALPTGLYRKVGGKWTLSPLPKTGGAQLEQAQVTVAKSLAGLFICFGRDANNGVGLSAKVTTLRVQMALPELVDGVPTLVYDVNVTVTKGTDVGTGEIKYWLGATDSLPRKMSLVYNSPKENGQGTGTYSYDAVDIQAPIP